MDEVKSLGRDRSVCFERITSWTTVIAVAENIIHHVDNLIHI